MWQDWLCLENSSKCHDMLGRSMRTQSRFYQAFKPSDFGWGVFVHRKLACVMKLKIRKLSQIERSHSKRQSAENLHGNRQVCDSADSTFCPTKRKAITYWRINGKVPITAVLIQANLLWSLSIRWHTPDAIERSNFNNSCDSLPSCALNNIRPSTAERTVVFVPCKHRRVEKHNRFTPKKY